MGDLQYYLCTDSVDSTDSTVLSTPDYTSSLEKRKWNTIDFPQLHESVSTPSTLYNCGNEIDSWINVSPAIDWNMDAIQMSLYPFLPSTLQDSNPWSGCDIKYDTCPPWSLSKSSDSSSDSSSFSLDQIPKTPRRCSKTLLKRPTPRLSLPGSSQQKFDVLRNALFHNPKPTRDQSSFLAKSLHVDEGTIESWQKSLIVDEIRMTKGKKQGKPLKAGRVAIWKQTIIRRGFQKVKDPSSCQITFLAAGLCISVDQLWQTFKKSASNDVPRTKDRRKVETKLLPTTHVLKKPPSLSDDKVQLVNSTVETTTKVDDSADTLLLSEQLATNLFDFLDWASGKDSEKFINPVDNGNAKSPHCQKPDSIVHKQEPVPDCKQPMEQTSGSIGICATPNISDTDMESIDDEEEPYLSPEEELADLLGYECSNLIEAFLPRVKFASVWDPQQLGSGFRNHAGGAENTPSSTSSHTPGNSSSSNTSASGSSGGKRKSSDDSGEGPNDLEPNDRDGNMDPPPPKKAKTRQVRYDCPIFRKPFGSESTVPNCAVNGLEFRNLWDHLRKAHYGCEVCLLKLDGKRADKTHLREREKDGSICIPGMRTWTTFDIGIDMFAELEEIYDNHTLSPDNKWKKWWKLLYPHTGEAPDPRHHDTISISTANLPEYMGLFRNMWDKEEGVPAANETELQTVLMLVEKLFRSFPIIQRCQRRSMQPRTPRTPATAPNMQAVAYAAGPSPAYIANAPEQEFSWDRTIVSGGDSPFCMVNRASPSIGSIPFGSGTTNSFSQELGGSGSLSFE